MHNARKDPEGRGEPVVWVVGHTLFDECLIVF